MNTLQIIHLAITVLLTTTILLQQRGSGLGDAFGDSGAVYASRRGAEKVLYYMSMVFAISFVVLSVLQIYLGDKV
jgi:protein translocase SecG subunit